MARPPGGLRVGESRRADGGSYSKSPSRRLSRSSSASASILAARSDSARLLSAAARRSDMILSARARRSDMSARGERDEWLDEILSELSENGSGERRRPRS